jgi:hypothetical protein
MALASLVGFAAKDETRGHNEIRRCGEVAALFGAVDDEKTLSSRRISTRNHAERHRGRRPPMIYSGDVLGHESFPESTLSAQ